MGARPFRTFADPYMHDFITTISANTYEPPSERAIGNKLLDECYDSCKLKVTAILAKQPKYHFILDESSDINDNRIINLSVVVKPFGSFFLHNYNAGKATLNAAFFVTWFFTMVEAFIRGDWTKVAGVATDTCSVIRLIWSNLETDLRLKSCFMIPCDSHGL